MQRENIRKAAAAISAARLRGTRLSALPDHLRPAGEAEAYEVQHEVHNILSANGRGRLVGHKIGCTTPVMQSFLGIPNPCSGALFQPAVHFQAGMLRHSDYLHVGVECEIAVFLGSDVPASTGGHTVDSIAEHVQAFFAAIEIVDDRWDDYAKIDTPSLIADDFFGAGCVLGEPVADWRKLDIASLRGEMRINDRKVGEGAGSDILGHPLKALAWLANSLAARGQTLRRGEIVALGSLVQTQWVSQMDRVDIEIDGLGTASAWFG